MLKLSKLELSWDTSWGSYRTLYGPVPALGAKADISNARVVLKSSKRGRGYAIHGHMSRVALKRAREEQKSTPISVGFTRDEHRLWWYQDKYYEADPDLDADDVLALFHEAENKKRLKLEKAHALMAMRRQLDTKAKRQSIPQDVKVAVWQRDGGRCVDCGSQQELEYDHIIPLVMGGSNTERNLQLLCAVCNRRKGGTLG